MDKSHYILQIRKSEQRFDNYLSHLFSSSILPINHPGDFTLSSEGFSRWELNMYRFVLSHVVSRPSLLLLRTTRWRCGAATARIRIPQRDRFFYAEEILNLHYLKHLSLRFTGPFHIFFFTSFQPLVAL